VDLSLLIQLLIPPHGLQATLLIQLLIPPHGLQATLLHKVITTLLSPLYQMQVLAAYLLSKPSIASQVSQDVIPTLYTLELPLHVAMQLTVNAM